MMRTAVTVLVAVAAARGVSPMRSFKCMKLLCLFSFVIKSTSEC